jgi:hypothetical protein
MGFMPFGSDEPNMLCLLFKAFRSGEKMTRRKTHFQLFVKKKNCHPIKF